MDIQLKRKDVSDIKFFSAEERKRIVDEATREFDMHKSLFYYYSYCSYCSKYYKKSVQRY